MATWCTNGYTSESITPWLHHPSDLWGRRPAYFTLSLFALGICICENTRPSLWGRSPACFLCLHLTGICICTEMAGFAFVGNLIPLVRACCTLGWQSVMNIHNLLKSKLKMLMMVGGVNGAWLRKEQLDRAMGCLFSWERRPMESSETPRTKGSKSVSEIIGLQDALIASCIDLIEFLCGELTMWYH